METTDWERVTHFSPNDNWGDVSLIKLDLVLKLDQLRNLADTPIFISCGTQGKHSSNSFHYKGMAADILFPKKTVQEIPKLAEIALATGFKGVGLYWDWKYSGKVIGGLHVDIRPGALPLSWTKSKSQKYIYNLSQKLLAELFSANA